MLKKERGGYFSRVEFKGISIQPTSAELFQRAQVKNVPPTTAQATVSGSWIGPDPLRSLTHILIDCKPTFCKERQTCKYKQVIIIQKNCVFILADYAGENRFHANSENSSKKRKETFPFRYYMLYYFFTLAVIKNIMIIKTWRQVKNKEKENGRK